MIFYYDKSKKRFAENECQLKAALRLPSIGFFAGGMVFFWVNKPELTFISENGRLRAMTQGNIYFDYNATTPVASEVQKAIPGWLKLWGNPSSIHWHGRGPKKLLRESRRDIANRLGCHPLELVFTSGGSESNNLAIQGCLKGIARKQSGRKKVVIGAIEHPSVLNQISFISSCSFS